MKRIELKEFVKGITNVELKGVKKPKSPDCSYNRSISTGNNKKK